MRTPHVPARPARPLVGLVVGAHGWLSPHLVGVVAGGSGLAQFTDNGSTDHYVKIQFEDVTRTYTLRWVDAAAQRLAIDFVVHGDQGLAGPWAASAQAGDVLRFSGPGGDWRSGESRVGTAGGRKFG